MPRTYNKCHRLPQEGPLRIYDDPRPLPGPGVWGLLGPPRVGREKCKCDNEYNKQDNRGLPGPAGGQLVVRSNLGNPFCCRRASPECAGRKNTSCDCLSSKLPAHGSWETFVILVIFSLTLFSFHPCRCRRISPPQTHRRQGS